MPCFRSEVRRSSPLATASSLAAAALVVVACSAHPGASGAPGSTDAAASVSLLPCGAPEIAHCNCPSNFYCCPTDGGCFLTGGEVRNTKCKDHPQTACAMPALARTPAPAPSPPPPSTGAPPPAPGGGLALPTRLRITSRCAAPIWIAHSDNVPAPQNVRLATFESQDYAIPEGGLASARFWPKVGCGPDGHGCSTGDNGEGGGKPCPAAGCQPPFDSKFEATFPAKGAPDASWYNLSQVDGFTLPFKVIPHGPGVEQGSCVTSDCSRLSLDACPGDDDLSGGGHYPPYAHEDLRVRDGAGHVVACMAPCKKWNYPAPWGLGQSEGAEPGLHMCCPTPIDPAKSPGQCTAENRCMTSAACREASDPVSVVHTRYVAAVRSMCPSAYSFAYDDEAGLHACPSTTSFEVVFCP